MRFCITKTNILNHMSKKTTYLLGILVTLIIGFFLHRYFCYNQSCTKNAVEEEALQEKTSTLFPFKFEDGKTTISSNDNFNFKLSDYAIIEPLSEDLMSYIKEMNKHLGKYTNKKLNITGLFKNGEKNASNFENLGIARAIAIKRFLTEHGLLAKQISTFGKKDNSLNPNQIGIINGPYNFTVEIIEDNEEDSARISAMKKNIMKDPVLVRFLPTEANTILYNEEKNKLKALANYLNASNSVSCTIVGHTDNNWSHESNMRLGKKRAEFTKRKLLEYKVNPNKIKTISKGETEPMGPNETTKGKALNRRTEVIIK